MKLVAGIDLGGTNTRVALVDEQGSITHQLQVPTHQYPVPNDLVQTISKWLRTGSLPPHAQLVGVGIGAPNGNYFTGTIDFAPNLKWPGSVPLAQMFADQLGVPVVLTNDAKAAALGEMHWGAAKHLKDFIFITLGTGLGCAIVANGQLIYGHDGLAGELGHITIFDNSDRVCGCGRKGCLETYASATGLVTTYRKALAAQAKDLQSEAAFDAAYIYQKALQGDAIAKQAFRFTASVLGRGLAIAATLTSPEKIFLYGGLTRAGSLLLGETAQSFEENLLPVYRNKIQIRCSSLPEDHAGVLGAAALIRQHIQNQSV